MTPEAKKELEELEQREKELFAEDERNRVKHFAHSSIYNDRSFQYDRRLINGKIERIWAKKDDIKECGLSSKQRKQVIDKRHEGKYINTDRIMGATDRTYHVEAFGKTFEVVHYNLYGLRGSPQQYHVKPIKVKA